MSRSPQAVLFDMDGTLLDSEHQWLAAEIEVMRVLGSDWTLEDQAQCLGGPLERVSRYMVDRSGTSVPAEEVGRLLLTTMEGLLRDSPLAWRPGAVEFLADTIEAGIPRALVTASWAVLVEALAERMFEEIGCDPFTAIVAGDHISHGKPHPEPYLRAAELIGVEPRVCLAIEDSPTGVRAAVAAGCVVVAIPHIASLPSDVGNVHVIDSLVGTTPLTLWQSALTDLG